MPSHRIKISFICYDKQVYFFNLDPRLKQPQIHVVSDPESQLFPFPSCSFDLIESYDVVLTLLDSLPTYFPKTACTYSCFLDAVSYTEKILKRSNGGKAIFV